MPHAQGWVDMRLQEIDKQLKLLDPNLSLQIGRLVNPKNGRVAREMLEVWRHCEDGADRCLAWWKTSEADRILLDIRAMRLGAPGHEDAQAAIDRANQAKAREVQREYEDSYGAMLEHALALQKEATEGKSTHYQVGGLRDRAD